MNTESNSGHDHVDGLKDQLLTYFKRPNADADGLLKRAVSLAPPALISPDPSAPLMRSD